MVHSHLKTGTGLGWLRHPGSRDGASSPLIHPLENLAHWQWGVGEAERGEGGVTCLVLAQVWGSAEKGELGKEVLSPGAPSRGSELHAHPQRMVSRVNLGQIKMVAPVCHHSPWSLRQEDCEFSSSPGCRTSPSEEEEGENSQAPAGRRMLWLPDYLYEPSECQACEKDLQVWGVAKDLENLSGSPRINIGGEN